MTSSQPTLSAGTRSALDHLGEDKRFGPLDTAFGRWLAERDPERGEAIARAGALVSAARAAGHSGLPTERIGGIEALRGSPLIGAPGEARPLVLDRDRLYLYRFWRAEERVAEAILARLRGDGSEPASDRTGALFGRLFPPQAGPDWQAAAAAAALHTRVLLIAGGPGTGKTTTVARLLALLLADDPEVRIELAAPTGKAANRLGASIRAQLSHHHIPEAVRDRIPHEAATLHRLLGYRPSSARFTRHRANPIPADVVIVDEASMIDLLLFDALLEAVPREARLILLGDPDQLASVEAGFVFGDLVRAGSTGAHGPAFTDHARSLGVEGLPEPDPSAPPMRDAVVTLTQSFRFTEGSGIGRLARAIRAGRADEAAELLSGSSPDVELIGGDALDAIVAERMGPYARHLCTAVDPAEAIAHLENVRLLSAVRWGPRGVHGLNARVEEWLLAEGLRIPGRDYRGRPIMITANDYEIELFNGDLGVMWPDANRPGVLFPAAEGEPRILAAHLLPAHESAWAVTVHKSQGSEFDEVLLVLPEEPIELLTRELLYTAVTRARRRVTVVGEVEILRAAVARPETRFTGLGGRLG